MRVRSRVAGRRLLARDVLMSCIRAVRTFGGIAKTLAAPAPAPAAAAATPPPPPFAVLAGRSGIPWRAIFGRSAVAFALRLEIFRFLAVARTLFRFGSLSMFVARRLPRAVIAMAALTVAGAIPLAVPAPAAAAAAAAATFVAVGVECVAFRWPANGE